jgi:hypothetical protein
MAARLGAAGQHVELLSAARVASSQVPELDRFMVAWAAPTPCPVFPGSGDAEAIGMDTQCVLSRQACT